MRAGRTEALTVAVTGAAGYIAMRLMESLAERSDIGRILAFDVRPASGPLPRKVIFDVLDVRDKALRARLEGVDVLVHLAFVMDPIHDESEMRDVNVNGSHNVFRAAIDAGVRKIVYPSSGTVYGAHPDNDFPLTEVSPLRANLDFSYPAHKLEVEYLIRELRQEHPEVVFTVFRPAIVFGPNVDNAWSHVLEFPMWPVVSGHRPPFQFVHEDDVAEGFAFAVENELDGEYNLCPDDHVALEVLLSVLRKRIIELPEWKAFDLAERMWRRGLAEAPAGMLHYTMHPWVMSPRKLAEAGFICKRSSRDAFLETAEIARRSYRVGKTRVERSTLRNVAAGAGVTGALLLWRRRRRAAA